MTVFANMAFGLKMRRVAKDDIRRKVREVAAMLDIEDLFDRKPAALSGGERQRVALGRAIVRKPKVFLFDEPLSNLDARLRVHMRTEIKNLHRKLETTILYVTHDQEEAMTLADRLVIMDNGVVQQCGAPLEVYNRPANRFVAGFVGTPPMNFLEGRIEGNGGASFVAGDIVRMTLPLELVGALTPHLGRPAVLGVRPEHLTLDGPPTQVTGTDRPNQPTAKGASIQSSVTVVEPLGDSVNVHLILPDGKPLVARVSPTVSVSPGDKVKVTVDVSRVHLFAADETGRRIA
jgi:multiple sugar transport system ATP-binding protein